MPAFSPDLLLHSWQSFCTGMFVCSSPSSQYVKVKVRTCQPLGHGAGAGCTSALAQSLLLEFSRQLHALPHLGVCCDNCSLCTPLLLQLQLAGSFNGLVSASTQLGSAALCQLQYGAVHASAVGCGAVAATH